MRLRVLTATRRGSLPLNECSSMIISPNRGMAWADGGIRDEIETK